MNLLKKICIILNDVLKKEKEKATDNFKMVRNSVASLTLGPPTLRNSRNLAMPTRVPKMGPWYLAPEGADQTVITNYRVFEPRWK